MAETQRTPGVNSNEPQPGQVITVGGTNPAPAVQQPVSQATAPEEYLPQAPAGSDGGISWTASEFVSHEKSPGWYGLLALAAAAIAGLVYLFTRDVISTVVVLVAALTLGVIAARKPRELQYRLDGSGVTIGQKHLNYELFKSFSVVPEGAFSSIVFTPLKRFSPLTTIYYAPQDEPQILGLLSDRLPFEERKRDVVDDVMRRIRF